MTKILELYGVSTRSHIEPDWRTVVEQQVCPYIHRRCTKTRKSSPDITIGTCSMLYGKQQQKIIICPNRLLERRQIFTDCLHLLVGHEPGNEIHVVPEVGIPGGNVDYFLVSVRNKEIIDFVGIELQTLDTTGTVWPERQRFLQKKGIAIEGDEASVDSKKPFGINWKMTAKTILMQLHHKVETFQELNKHLVLVIPDDFMDYIRKEFRFDHLNQARRDDSAHIHVYKLRQVEESGFFHLELASRFSTDADGIAKSLGLKTESRVEMEEIMSTLRMKISENTLFTLS